MRSTRPPLVRLALAGLGTAARSSGWSHSAACSRGSDTINRGPSGRSWCWAQHSTSDVRRPCSGRGWIMQMALWHRGLAPIMIVTGGTGTGDTTSEAAVSQRYVAQHGVPVQAILLETEGRTTSESMAGVSALMASQGRRDVLLVSDPFHMLRLIDPRSTPRTPALRVPDADQPDRRESDRAMEVRIERIGESPVGLHSREERSVIPRHFVSICALIAVGRGDAGIARRACRSCSSRSSRCRTGCR